MTDEKKKDDKDGKDAKKIDDEQLKDVAGGTGPRKASATFQIVLDEKTGDSKKRDGGTYTSGSGTVTFDG
jgi:hypothetical protein